MSDWKARAACRGKDTAMFFPQDEAAVEVARAICEPCPVKAECEAAGHGQLGIWGGLTPAERHSPRRKRASKPKPVDTSNPYLLPKKPCDVCEAMFWPYSLNARFCPDCRALGIVRMDRPA